MKSIELSKTAGWIAIPGSCKIIIAHYKDGATKKMSIEELLTMGHKSNSIIKIDCYDSEEELDSLKNDLKKL